MNSKRMKMELFDFELGDGNGETDQGDKDKYWSDHELSSWADQVSNG